MCAVCECSMVCVSVTGCVQYGCSMVCVSVTGFVQYGCSMVCVSVTGCVQYGCSMVCVIGCVQCVDVAWCVTLTVSLAVCSMWM